MGELGRATHSRLDAYHALRVALKKYTDSIRDGSPSDKVELNLAVYQDRVLNLISAAREEGAARVRSAIENEP